MNYFWNAKGAPEVLDEVAGGPSFAPLQRMGIPDGGPPAKRIGLRLRFLQSLDLVLGALENFADLGDLR